MRRRELEHFYIGNSYGGNQGWFRSFMMRIGGCGAETACDSSLYFALNLGIEGIYPFDVHRLSKRDYVDFAHIMEKYLWPRMSGIDRTEIFVDGYAKYLRDRGVDSVSMTTLEGTEPYEAAAEAVMRQIDAGYPVPTLILNHRDRKYADYNWHWFLINGYEVSDDQSTVLVKAVTYSSYEWLDLRRLWNTGHIRRGGLVLFSSEGRPAPEE
ncbi:MAG: hypothetical protein IJY32_07910 [Mogibacterium sp.]|nr:hypothetical protein [Mogibacterium sp.]